MKYARLVINNLLRNRRRALLTVLSIALSLFVFSALLSLPSAVDAILSPTASSTRLVCHSKAGLTYALPEAYRRRIAATPHVEAVVAQSFFPAMYREPSDQFAGIAVDHEQFDRVWPEWFSKDAVLRFKRLRTACVVGPGMMQRFHWRVGQQVVVHGTGYPFDLTLNIVGELTSRAPSDFLIFRRDYLEQMRGQPGFLSDFWIKVDDPSSVPAVIAAVDGTFADSDAETQTESESVFIGNFLSYYRTLFRMTEILGLIVVLTIGLVALNTAAMSTRERRSEIAVMRSIGFRRGLIIKLLLAESVVMGFTGGLLGCGAAYLVLKAISVGGPALAPQGAITMPPYVLAEGLMLATLIGLLSGLFPAHAATRRTIVDALRSL
ncbi:MAG: FtsX-like permease family protein [Candidatus Binataceae bacterium]